MAIVKRAQKTVISAHFVSLCVTLGLSACSGPDHLTDPVVPAGGNIAVSTGGATSTTSTGGTTSSTNAGGTTSGGRSSSVALGGTANGGTDTTGTQTTAGATSFDWGAASFDAANGAAVTYQGHYSGMACLATCHSHTYTAGGTVYLADGITPAANGQVGLLVDGTLTTTYFGAQGNFFVSVPSAASWATARIAIRTLTGTATMPINASASGNCNSCHDSTNRITVP